MNRMQRIWAVLAMGGLGWGVAAEGQHPIHVTYQWHMHQPIYYPYESVQATDNNNRFVFSVAGVHGERAGNYGDWPKNAVQSGADRGLPHAGVQVSFSGSLMENLRGLWGDGWRENWRWARNGLRTTRNNPRLDLVGFAYHHSLMPLTSPEAMRMQIKLHREAYQDNWDTGGTYSKGFFPPESSFALHMIPALVAEGIEWVMVDSGHFDRTLEDFPWSSASSIRPNRAELRNGTAATKASQWVQLQNVWAPTPVAAPFSYQPHRVRYVDPYSDPANPAVTSMTAVPAARYEGNENGRGGYGAFKPENVWGSNVDKNNNAARPMLILCHSDGDNFGMKNYDAFHGQHNLFLDMIQSNPNFEHTTVQDYLDMYPVPVDDVIHVEAGSWIGIDGGTPYFDKWIENNARDGQHPDYWSWSVLVAAQNRVLHADALENSYSMNDVRWGIGSDTAKAWRYFLQSETSCHWYWDYDTANPWDGNATRAANLAVAEAAKVINRHAGNDPVGPAIFHPQRKIWNPGGKHWNEPETQPSDFDVWTFVDDVSGVASVRLKWRTGDFASYRNVNEYAHELYAHTPGKNSPWNTVAMTGDWYPTGKGPNVPDPAARAQRYTGRIEGASDTLVSYFIEAVDNAGNTNRSIILHTWVGDSTGGGTNVTSYVTFDPPQPTGCEPVTISYKKAGSPLGSGQVYIHVGRNDWQDTLLPNPAMTDSGDAWTYVYTPASGTEMIDVVFNNGAGIWDSNGGQDWHLAVTGCDGPADPSVMLSPPAPVQCQPLVITYTPADGVLSNTSPVYLYRQIDGQPASPTGLLMAAAGAGWVYTNEALFGASSISFYFGGAAGPYDTRGGSNWVYAVGGCATNGPAAVTWTPESPAGCEAVTIRYKPNDGPLKTAQPVYLHLGRNGWQDVPATAPAMTLGGDGVWSYTHQPLPGTYALNVVFNNGAGVWDNNSEQDWNIALSGCGAVSGLAITDPFTPVTVGGAQATYTVRGLAALDLAGLITWSNAASGATGTLPVAAVWSNAVPLDVGTNVVIYTATNAVSGVTTTAIDRASDAAYADGWNDGENGGTGWGAWQLLVSSVNPNENGHFLADAASVNIGTPAFGLYANSGNLSEAKRAMTAPLAVGQTVAVKLDNGFINTGSGVGVALQNQLGDTLWQFFFNGGDSTYSISGGTTDVGWTSGGLDIEVTLTGATTYRAAITPYGGAMRIIEGALDTQADMAVRALRVWNWNAGSGSDYDVFFNDPAILSPGGGAGMTYSATAVVVRAAGFVDSDDDGIDDAWEMDEFENLTTANRFSDWDQDGVLDIEEAVAGTNPKNGASFLRAHRMAMRPEDGRLVIEWSGAAGRSYDLYRSTNLAHGVFDLIGSNLPFMPSMNVFTDEVSGASVLIYRIGVR